MKVWGILLYWLGIRGAQSNYVINEYYEDAFANGFSYVWENMPFIDRKFDIKSLSFYRAMTCFYNDDAADLTERRALQYTYLSQTFKSDEAGTNINKYQKIIPIESNVKSIIRRICFLYDKDPMRQFSQEENLNTELTELYSDAKFNLTMREAYQAAKLTGLAAILPQWINGKLNFTIFTPDQFRTEKKVADFNEPEAFYYPDYNEDGRLVIKGITAESYLQYNISNGQILSEIANPYGIMPIIWVRLENSQSFYTGGKFNLIENQLNLNQIEYQARQDILFNVCPIKVAVNIPPDEIIVAPNAILAVPDVDENMAEPSIYPVQFDTHYTELNYYKIEREKEFQQKEGIPLSMIESQGNPPSGVSRLLELIDLIEIRKKDGFILTQIEKEIVKKLIIIANVDQGTKWDIDKVEFSIKYPPESVIKEPSEEFEHDTNLLNKYMYDPVEFTKKYGNVPDNATYEEVKAIIDERKEQKKELFGISEENTEDTEIDNQFENIKKEIGGDNGTDDNMGSDEPNR